MSHLPLPRQFLCYAVDRCLVEGSVLTRIDVVRATDVTLLSLRCAEDNRKASYLSSVVNRFRAHPLTLLLGPGATFVPPGGNVSVFKHVADMKAALSEEHGVQGVDARIFQSDPAPDLLACIRPPELLDWDTIRADLIAQTWMGNPAAPAALREHKILLTVGADARALMFTPRTKVVSNYAVAGKGIYFGIHNSDNKLHAKCYFNTGNGATESVTLDGQKILCYAGFGEREFYGRQPTLTICFYFCESDISDFSQFADEWARATCETISRVKSAIINRANEISAKQSAELTTRLARISECNFVYVKNKKLFIEPRGEMDVAILSAKLESEIGQIFKDFKLLEHTPRRGIDAIASFRKGENAAEKLHFVEFEFHLSSFFVHEHSFDQVDLIICWEDNLGSLDLQQLARDIYGQDAEGSLIGEGWARTLRIGSHSIPVLVLRKCPNLRVGR